MSWTPWDFQTLKKHQPAAETLETILAALFPPGTARLKSLSALEQALQRLVRGSASLHFEGYRIVESATLSAPLTSPQVVLSFGVAPTQEKAFLFLDPVMALILVERVLGGDLKELPLARPLTELEQGVLGYFCVELAGILNKFLPEAQTPLRWLHLDTALQNPKDLGIQSKFLACVRFRLALAEQVGSLELYVPERFFSETLKACVPATAPQAPSAARLQQLTALRLPLELEVGRVELNATELMSLNPGDVVLLEKSQLRLHAGAWLGVLEMTGRYLGFHVEWNKDRPEALKVLSRSR